MTVIDTLLSRVGLARSNPALAFNTWANYFSYNGVGYPTLGSQTLGSKQEVPTGGFESYVQSIYKTNGIVFACMLARLLLFSEARFQFRRRVGGRPGELFGTSALELLEHPWTNATTGDMLSRAIQDADLAGNSFLAARGNKLRRLRPDWVTIVVGSQSEPDDPYWAIDAEVVGYIHQPPGSAGRRKPDILLPGEVAHFAPIPDPAFRFRGMSWLQPVIAEVMGDQAATTHKLNFFEHGATPNMIVSLDKSMTKELYDAFITKMKEQHEGAQNAYRTLYLAGGSTATVVGANMRQIDFKVTQGAGETRIAAAAGVPPVIVGLSEGLAASTYSNYAQARRRFADGTMRPLWRNMAGSLAHLINVPSNCELWYDDRDISFLREDLKDEADIHQVKATTIKTFIDAGFEPDSAAQAVISGDFNRLKHTGLPSVQLQQPTAPAAVAAPAPQLALPAKTEPPKRDEDDLTPREHQMVDRLARGMSNKQIAAELDISIKTVENHVNSVLGKLGLSSRSEVAEVHVHLPQGMVNAPVNVQPATPPNVEVHVAPKIEQAPPRAVKRTKVFQSREENGKTILTGAVETEEEI